MVESGYLLHLEISNDLSSWLVTMAYIVGSHLPTKLYNYCVLGKRLVIKVPARPLLLQKQKKLQTKMTALLEYFAIWGRHALC